VRPPWFIIGRTAWPPCRVTPVTSTLGFTVRFKFPPIPATMNWLSRARLPLLATAVAVVALGIVLRPGASEPLIRLVGLALQILGLVTVVAGVVSLRAYFNQPTYRSLLRDWLAECPILIQTYTLNVESARHAHTGSSVTLTHTVPIPEDGPLEARLTAVTRNLAALRHETATYQAETTATLSPDLS
jgi:hypothetical protein